MTDFESAYQQLELRFEHMVQRDNEVYDAGSIYLPNVTPLLALIGVCNAGNRL